MKSRILGLLAIGLMGVSGSAASMANDSGDPNQIAYHFWSPILTGTLDGQPFQGQLTGVATFLNDSPPFFRYSIDGVQFGIGGLEPVANQPEKWCRPDDKSCITKVPGGLDVQISVNGNDFVESLEITSTGTSISFDGQPFSGHPVSLSASGGRGTWEVFVNAPEPSPLALWGAALLVSCLVLLQRSRIVSKATGLRP